MLKNAASALEFAVCNSETDIPFSEDKVRKIARKAMQDYKRHAVMIARKAGRLVGFVYCSVGKYHIGTGVLLTSIHNINVVKDVRASLSGGKIALSLFKWGETWSKARNASEIFLHVSSGFNLASIHALAKKMGFVFVGGSYGKYDCGDTAFYT